MISASSHGFVVRLAAVASPRAQIHQAPGWRSRGRTAISAPPTPGQYAGGRGEQQHGAARHPDQGAAAVVGR
jgi:hypothetical protein